MDTVLSVTHNYTDIILYQMYGRYEVQEPSLNRWTKVTDRPFLNGDSAFTMITEDMPRPYGPIADNLEQRAEWTKEFMQKAFSRADFVGWHYCGLVMRPLNTPEKREGNIQVLLISTVVHIHSCKRTLRNLPKHYMKLRT